MIEPPDEELVCHPCYMIHPEVFASMNWIPLHKVGKWEEEYGVT